MPSKHAQFSPSSSPYWYNEGNGCPGRVMWHDDRTFSHDAGPAAHEGTRLHEIAERVIATGSGGIAAPDLEKIGAYADYVRYGRGEDHGTVLYLEQEVSLEWITGEKDATGSVDALLMPSREGVLPEVIDLKTGMVRVEPDSSQLRMYAAGALGKKMLKVTPEVVLTIHQGGEARHAIYTGKELLKFAKKVKKYVKAAQKRYAKTGELEFNPSDKNCTWCMHLAVCPKLQGFKDQQAANEFALPDPYDADVIASDLDLVGPMRKWCDSLEKLALDLAKSGKELPGYKLVAARTNRKWTEQAEAKLFALLGDAAYNRKLISLSAAEKLVDDETMAEIVVKPEGKPQLAPLKDKRPAIDDATTDFKNA